ncbi:hypothetical protein HC62_03705 [Acetobacter tropicalis]|uniref:Uncharacterized protein n=1 Tax=Acetobacter tropicalis TaxID=104102 RepID=A0A252AAR2_9PROT|nr:hypothetical protein HC62_03705 [Acetobacter tropicalis]
MIFKAVFTEPSVCVAHPADEEWPLLPPERDGMWNSVSFMNFLKIVSIRFRVRYFLNRSWIFRDSENPLWSIKTWQ